MKPPRVLDNLNTCPPDLLAAYMGDCEDCGRTMARASAFQRHGAALKRWFVQASNASVCQSCRTKRWERETGNTRKARRKRPRRPPKPVPDLIWHLRMAVGACVTCGWAWQPPDPDEDDPGSGPHRCASVLEQNDLELEESA